MNGTLADLKTESWQKLYKLCTVAPMTTYATRPDRPSSTTFPLQGLSDAQLMARLLEEDISAFEEIYRRHGQLAFRVAYGVVRETTAAEDITQEAFLGLWRRAAKFDPSRSPLRSWLLLMVRSRGIDHIRRARNHSTQLLQDELHERHLQAPEHTEAQAAALEESREIRGLLSAIPVKQRQVVELVYYREMTHAEIAAKLGLPLGTVKGRLRLAHEKLHRALAPASGELELAAVAG
jgi:RNA polymerase sigma-70 factor, ECF subfamily